MNMHNPPHPGETLREDVLPALGLSVTEAAAQLNVSRITLSRVLNGNAAISSDMALRLEQWLGVENGGAADLWLGMQAAYDLWHARKATAPIIRKIKKVTPVRREEHALARGPARDKPNDKLELPHKLARAGKHGGRAPPK